VSVGKYLKPKSSSDQAAHLARSFVVKGFAGAARPARSMGSRGFSEHRRYASGDDPKDIDWSSTQDRQDYVKKFEAETNITGYL